MGSKFGYAYSYELRMDGEIMTPEELPEFEFRKRFHSWDSKYFFFKVTTQFIVEDVQGGATTVVGSEKFHACFSNEVGNDSLLFDAVGSRLYVEYWMTPREAYSLCVSAGCFARKREMDHPHLDVIPVFVDIKVCTVQQAGEPFAHTFERAIRPERLCPLYINIYSMRLPVDLSLKWYLRRLPRARVESVEQGSALMDVCDICSCSPTVGDQISRLKCGHAFHSHCVVKWLVRSNLCPSCNAQEHEFPIPKMNAPALESLSLLSVS